MGVDPQLGLNMPTVMIHGEKFNYGKNPEADEFLVSHPTDGKRYWSFRTEDEMIDFLENLPDSADPPMLKGVSLYNFHGIIPAAEYVRHLEQHEKILWWLLRDKRREGTTFRYKEQ